MKPVSNPAAFSQSPVKVMAGGGLLFLPLGAQVVRGVTDANGLTMTLQTKQAESLTLTVPESARQD